MSRRRIQVVTPVFGLLLLFASSLPARAEAPAKAEPLAEVNGAAITAEEVDKALGAALARLQEQISTMKRQKVEQLIAERLLAAEAAKRDVSVETLLDAEVTGKVGLVTEQEIERSYQANKARFKGEEPQVREQIRAQLQNQKLAARRDELLRSLRSQAKVVTHLQAPAVFRVAVTADGGPSKGPAAAPVTIVEFTDFHCPFCKKVQPTLAEIQSKYGDRVRVVHKDYPIDQLHPAARKGHEAARCAKEQGKFWEYNDVLYANAPQGSLDQLKAYAKQVGLNMAAFDSCLTSGKYQAAVQKDIEEGSRAGVTGTPAFFVNGRLLSGAQPIERFVQVIEDELARAR